MLLTRTPSSARHAATIASSRHAPSTSPLATHSLHMAASCPSACPALCILLREFFSFVAISALLRSLSPTSISFCCMLLAGKHVRKHLNQLCPNAAPRPCRRPIRNCYAKFAPRAQIKQQNAPKLTRPADAAINLVAVPKYQKCCNINCRRCRTMPTRWLQRCMQHAANFIIFLQSPRAPFNEKNSIAFRFLLKAINYTKLRILETKIEIA